MGATLCAVVRGHMKSIKIVLSMIIVVALLAGCQQEIELSDISDLTAAPAKEGIYVSWAASVDADCYYVYRAARDEESYSYWGVTEKTSFTDITVLNGQRYSYRVYPALKTKDGYNRGNTYMSSESVFMLMTPAIESIQTSSYGCTLRWESMENASSYSIYRSQSDGTGDMHIGDATLNYYIDETHAGSEDYRYQIKMNSVDNGTMYTSEASKAVMAYRIPTITSAVREDISTAVIEWSSVVEGAEYGIYRASTPDGKYELLGVSEQLFYRDIFAMQEVPKENPVSETADETLTTETEDITTEVTTDETSEETVSEPTQEAQETSIAMVAADYYYKIQVRADNEGAISYTNKSESVMLDKSAATSSFFAAAYTDFVSDSMLLDPQTSNAIRVDEFEKDLIYLQTHGYVTMTSKEVNDYVNNIALMPETAVMLTIEDARYGVYEYAYPLLQKYGMKAVLSVVGEHADSEQDIMSARKYCNWEEISEMVDSGHVELASGSYYLGETKEDGVDKRDGVMKKDYETRDQYLKALSGDMTLINNKLRAISGIKPAIFTYPTAARNSDSDDVLLSEFDYQLLLGDNDARLTRMNHFIDGATPSTQLLLINCRDRLTGTTLEEYIIAAQRFNKSSLLDETAVTE